jgi:hypothetical protein
VKKVHIVIIIVLSIIIGALIMIIIGKKEKTVGDLMLDDMKKSYNEEQKKLNSIKEDYYLGWWIGSHAVKIEINSIYIYNTSAESYKIVDDNTIEDSYNEIFKNKNKTGFFGMFVSEKAPGRYIKIGKLEKGYFTEKIKYPDDPIVKPVKNNYEKIGITNYKTGDYFCFLNHYKDINGLEFKNGKLYNDNEVVVEIDKETNGDFKDGVVKIKGIGKCVRMNKIYE